MNDDLIPMLIVIAIIMFPVTQPQLTYMAWLKIRSWFRK